MKQNCLPIVQNFSINEKIASDNNRVESENSPDSGAENSSQKSPKHGLK